MPTTNTTTPFADSVFTSRTFTYVQQQLLASLLTEQPLIADAIAALIHQAELVAVEKFRVGVLDSSRLAGRLDGYHTLRVCLDAILAHAPNEIVDAPVSR